MLRSNIKIDLSIFQEGYYFQKYFNTNSMLLASSALHMIGAKLIHGN
jgi:hypothetical protein